MQCFTRINVAKLKRRDLKYRGHTYFETLRPHIISQTLAYLRSHNKFPIFIAKGLSGEDLFKLSKILETQKGNESVTEKKYFRWKRNE